MPDLHVNMAIVDESMEVAMVHNVGRNDGNQNVHASIIRRLHGGAQVKVFDVTHHAASGRCGHGTVEEQFGCDEVHSFCADIAGIFDVVAANSPLDMMWDSLFWAMHTNNAQVSGTVTMGNDRNRNKNIVLVLGITAIPCAKWCISVALACCHSAPSELLLSLAYSASSPVLGLKGKWCGWGWS